MNILHIGDVVGKPGRDAVKNLLEAIKQEYSIDFVIVNAENAAGGSGVTSKIATEMFSWGCDVLTLGDHVWDQKESEPFLGESDRIVRPINFPEGTPGQGWCVKETKRGQKVGVVNLLGRVFMRYHVECPFRAMEKLLPEIRKQTSLVMVDFHAEATSEKVAMGHFLNGQVSAVMGTHTHIQTADDQILSEGTAYITDVGMTGPCDSVIGQKKENIIKRFLSCRPIKFSVASEDIKIQGIVVTVDEKTGHATRIVRLRKDYRESLTK